MITGFRLAPGGAQEFYGVIPDVSTYGKIIGGGIPVGAVGGTAEAMRLMEYDREPESILVAGTFNGNPLVIAAGMAVLRRLSREPQLYTRLNAMGDRFRSEINRFAQEEGLSRALPSALVPYSGCTPLVDRSTTSAMRTGEIRSPVLAYGCCIV